MMVAFRYRKDTVDGMDQGGDGCLRVRINNRRSRRGVGRGLWMILKLEVDFGEGELLHIALH